ncbi:MAG: hypothetical protein ABJA20_04015 [Novosphingobium sp.]
MTRKNGAALVAIGAVSGAAVLALALYLAGDLGEREAESESERQGAQASPDPVRDMALRARLGIKVAALSAFSGSQEASGFARGLDAGSLAAIVAEIDSAQAVVAASQAESARLDALYRNDVSASRRSVEAARAQALADLARLRLARQRIALEYGPGLARLGGAGVRQLVSRVTGGEAALVRIDIPGALLAAGTAVQIRAGQESAIVRVLGPAAAADSKLQSAGVLAVLSGTLARQLLAGRVLPVQTAVGPSIAGVLVPRDAVVRYQGQLWVFRQEAAKFERIILLDPQPIGEGWLVRSGLKPGDVIAIHGGTGLLALEDRPAQSAGEED